MCLSQFHNGGSVSSGFQFIAARQEPRIYSDDSAMSTKWVITSNPERHAVPILSRLSDLQLKV